MQNKNTIPPEIRYKNIISQLETNHHVKVSELSKELNVTEMTIRRDLESLEKKGLIQRVHGGAVKTQIYKEPLFSQKFFFNIKEKKAIANTAASLIEDNDVVILNSGSTTLRIFSLIKANGVTCITNNPRFANESIPANIQIISTGGFFRPESCTLVGTDVEKCLSKIKANKVFLGIDGFSIQNGLTTPVKEEASINSFMMDCASIGQVIVVADSSKIEYCSNFKVSDLDRVDILITDKKIKSKQKTNIEKLGIKVIIAN